MLPIQEINATNSPLPVKDQEEPPFLLKAVAQLTLASAFGYVQYFVFKNFIDKDAEAKPFVLRSVCTGGIILGMELAYRAALKILGSREKYENPLETQGTFDKFRARSWKIISKAEAFIQRMDAVFSKILKIRPTKEIEEKKVSNVDLKFIEIFRKALGIQFKSIFLQTIPLHLSVTIIKGAGYILPGSQLLLGWEVLGLLLGILGQVMHIYEERFNT